VRDLGQAAEYNGKTGVVVSWDEAKGRYEVRLAGGGRLMLKPRNLTQLCRVELAGLAAKPELNGRFGQVSAYDAERGRYMVLLEGPQPVALSLQPSSCALPRGTRVVLSGLSSAGFNGQMAQILSVDREAARYTVHCQDGRQAKVKFANALC